MTRRNRITQSLSKCGRAHSSIRWRVGPIRVLTYNLTCCSADIKVYLLMLPGHEYDRGEIMRRFMIGFITLLGLMFLGTGVAYAGGNHTPSAPPTQTAYPPHTGPYVKPSWTKPPSTNTYTLPKPSTPKPTPTLSTSTASPTPSMSTSYTSVTVGTPTITQPGCNDTQGSVQFPATGGAYQYTINGASINTMAKITIKVSPGALLIGIKVSAGYIIKNPQEWPVTISQPLTGCSTIVVQTSIVPVSNTSALAETGPASAVILTIIGLGLLIIGAVMIFLKPRPKH